MRLLLASIVLLVASTHSLCAPSPVSPPPPTPTFAQVIVAAEARTHQLHRQMEAAFDELRANVSAHLSHVTSGILTVLMPAIEQVAQHKLDCPTNTTAYDIHELLGWELAYCTLSSDKQITALVDDFFDTLMPVQAASVTLLSSVLAHVAEANPVDDPALVLDELERTLDAHRVAFAGVQLPRLERSVDAVAASVAGMTATMGECATSTVQQLDRIVCLG